MKYLHTMIRISDVDASLRFFCEGLGLKETRRKDSEKGRYTLIFLAPPNDKNAETVSYTHLTLPMIRLV